MKINHYINFFSSLIVVLIVACTTSDQYEYNKGLSRVEKNDFKGAILYFKQSLKKNPQSDFALQAARMGSKVSFFDLKDFPSAIEFHKFLIMYSADTNERLDSQKKISNIYFENLNDYNNSILEINRLIAMLKNKNEIIKERLSLAKAYFYLNNFIQAESESDWVINNTKEDDILFLVLVLKGNIHLAKKDINKASEIFQFILKKYPERAVRENVATTLAVSYEELKDYKNAIQVLEAIKPIHPMPEYIDLRIKRLQVSQKNQPGIKSTKKK